MTLKFIHPDALEAAIQAIRKGNTDKFFRQYPNLLSLRILNEESDDLARLHELYCWIEVKTQNKLNLLRQELVTFGERPSENSPNDWIKQLESDFNSGDQALMDWSALYHRYFGIEGDQIPSKWLDKLDLSPKTFRNHVVNGLARLAMLLQQAEYEVSQMAEINNLCRNVPVTTHEIYGIDPLVEEITVEIMQQTPPYFLCLKGIGGIGKTTVAVKVVCALAKNSNFAEKVEDVLWVKIRKNIFNPSLGNMESAFRHTQNLAATGSHQVETLEALTSELLEQCHENHFLKASLPEKIERLKELFHERCYVVVIDDLELIPDIEAFAEILKRWGGRSYFLMASRHDLGQELEFAKYRLIQQLSLSQIQVLVKGYSKSKILLSSREVEAIYHIIGGNALAWRLVVGQVFKPNHREVLSYLEAIKPDKDSFQNMETDSEDIQKKHDAMLLLFDYIYRETWRLLDEPTKNIFRSLISLHSDAPFDLTALYELANDEMHLAQFLVALNNLLEFCMLDVVYIDHQPHYLLHNLTLTFLRSIYSVLWSN